MAIVATHRMEEEYSRLILEYDTPELEAQIFAVIEQAKKATGLTPAITHSNKSRAGEMGEIYIELENDENRTSGDFHEMVLKALNITVCD